MFDDEVKDKFGYWEYRKWSTTLSEWDPGSEIELVIKIVFKKDLFGGESYFDKGLYTLGLLVSVE